MQVYAWNSAQEGGNTADADYRWYQNGGSVNGRRWLKLALPQYVTVQCTRHTNKQATELCCPQEQPH